jgi:hypothetical protein
MKVTVNTKSNFRNLNGVELDVSEIHGTRVSCAVFNEDLNASETIDFTLSEVVKFSRHEFEIA